MSRFASTPNPVEQQDNEDVRVRRGERRGGEVSHVQRQATDHDEERPVDAALPVGGTVGSVHQNGRQEDQQDVRPRLLAVVDRIRKDRHEDAGDQAREATEQGSDKDEGRHCGHHASDRVREADRDFARSEVAQGPSQDVRQRRLIDPGCSKGQRPTDGRLTGRFGSEDLIQPQALTAEARKPQGCGDGQDQER